MIDLSPEAIEQAEAKMREILTLLGHDTEREGLIDTPRRYVKFMSTFTSYPEPNFTTFSSEDYDQMIVVREIQFYSLCEHHLVPFFGKANVAYIPDRKIVGLSKIPRLVRFYAQGLQNQERITKQVATRLQSVLAPKGVAVNLRATHLCMCMRGVESHGAETTTTALEGAFKDDLNAREEFLSQLSKKPL